MTLNKLRQTRLSQGKSQTFMAKKLGYKFPSGYANIEMGRTKPSLEKAKLIADVLGVDVEELFLNKSYTKRVINQKKSANKRRHIIWIYPKNVPGLKLSSRSSKQLSCSKMIAVKRKC